MQFRIFRCVMIGQCIGNPAINITVYKSTTTVILIYTYDNNKGVIPYAMIFYTVYLTYLLLYTGLLLYILFIPTGVRAHIYVYIPCALMSIYACICEKKVGTNLQLEHDLTHRIVYTYLLNRYSLLHSTYNDSICLIEWILCGIVSSNCLNLST